MPTYAERVKKLVEIVAAQPKQELTGNERLDLAHGLAHHGNGLIGSARCFLSDGNLEAVAVDKSRFIEAMNGLDLTGVDPAVMEKFKIFVSHAQESTWSIDAILESLLKDAKEIRDAATGREKV